MYVSVEAEGRQEKIKDKRKKTKARIIACNDQRNKNILNSSNHIIMKQSIGFIGGGRVTRILLQAFKNKNVKFSKIVVTDTNPEVLANLKKQFPDS